MFVAISLASIGNYYVYDSIGPVADLLVQSARFLRYPDWNPQRHLQPAEHLHGADRGVLVDRFNARSVTP